MMNVLGFITAGPLGALAGYALGSLFEHGLDAVNRDGDHRDLHSFPTRRSSDLCARFHHSRSAGSPGRLCPRFPL